VVLLTFIASLENVDAALTKLVWSMTAFAVGLICSGMAAPAASKRLSELADYHAAATTRDSCLDAVSKLPKVIASPQRIADSANRERDHYKNIAAEKDAEAEKSWMYHTRWKAIHRALLGISSIGFAMGLALPIILIHVGVSFQ